LLLGTIIKVSAKQIEITPMVEVLEEARAPEFTLPTQNGELVGLSDFLGNKVVLYFFVKDDTPGCTKEACSFRDGFREIRKKGAVILGISIYGVESHKKFASKYNLPFTLLSDKDAKVAKMYGVWKLKNLYGKKYWGVERSTLIIDENGKVAKVFRKVRVEGHFDEVLSAISFGKE